MTTFSANNKFTFFENLKKLILNFFEFLRCSLLSHPMSLAKNYRPTTLDENVEVTYPYMRTILCEVIKIIIF